MSSSYSQFLIAFAVGTLILSSKAEETTTEGIATSPDWTSNSRAYGIAKDHTDITTYSSLENQETTILNIDEQSQSKAEETLDTESSNIMEENIEQQKVGGRFNSPNISGDGNLQEIRGTTEILGLTELTVIDESPNVNGDMTETKKAIQSKNTTRRMNTPKILNDKNVSEIQKIIESNAKVDETEDNKNEKIEAEHGKRRTNKSNTLERILGDYAGKESIIPDIEKVMFDEDGVVTPIPTDSEMYKEHVFNEKTSGPTTVNDKELIEGEKPIVNITLRKQETDMTPMTNLTTQDVEETDNETLKGVEHEINLENTTENKDLNKGEEPTLNISLRKQATLDWTTENAEVENPILNITLRKQETDIILEITTEDVETKNKEAPMAVERLINLETTPESKDQNIEGEGEYITKILDFTTEKTNINKNNVLMDINSRNEVTTEYNEDSTLNITLRKQETDDISDSVTQNANLNNNKEQIDEEHKINLDSNIENKGMKEEESHLSIDFRKQETVGPLFDSTTHPSTGINKDEEVIEKEQEINLEPTTETTDKEYQQQIILGRQQDISKKNDVELTTELKELKNGQDANLNITLGKQETEERLLVLSNRTLQEEVSNESELEPTTERLKNGQETNIDLTFRKEISVDSSTEISIEEPNNAIPIDETEKTNLESTTENADLNVEEDISLKNEENVETPKKLKDVSVRKSKIKLSMRQLISEESEDEPPTSTNSPTSNNTLGSILNSKRDLIENITKGVLSNITDHTISNLTQEEIHNITQNVVANIQQNLMKMNATEDLSLLGTTEDLSLFTTTEDLSLLGTTEDLSLSETTEDVITTTMQSTQMSFENDTSSNKTTPKKPKTIVVEHVEDSNYLAKNNKDFLQYPCIRKTPPEKDSTNNYTTPTILTTKHIYKTREPSTWMTFLTTSKTKPTTTLASTTTKLTTKTTLTTKATPVTQVGIADSNGQGSYNMNKLSNSKKSQTKIITKRIFKYQNVKEETPPKDAAIQKLLKYIIECKANGDNNCSSNNTSNDNISQLLYENEHYKLTGNKNYNTSLVDSVAKMNDR